MKRSVMRALGILLILAGVLFVLNSFSGITGFAVAELVGKATGSIIGLVFIVGGIVLFLRGQESELVKISDGGVRIIRSKRFNRSIRQLAPKDKKIIERAIRKIGTGCGNEEKLRRGGYGIKATKGGRVIFDYNENKSNAELQNYTPQHKYERL